MSATENEFDFFFRMGFLRVVQNKLSRGMAMSLEHLLMLQDESE